MVKTVKNGEKRIINGRKTVHKRWKTVEAVFAHARHEFSTPIAAMRFLRKVLPGSAEQSDPAEFSEKRVSTGGRSHSWAALQFENQRDTIDRWLTSHYRIFVVRFASHHQARRR
jgi:hypothetical protein